MGKSPWNEVKRGRDVTKILERNNVPIRNGKGSHRVARLPDGEVLTYYENGEFPKGIRRKYIKALLTAGFLGAAFTGGAAVAAGGLTPLLRILLTLIL